MCDIYVYLHNISFSRDWEQNSRARTPDCCCVVLLLMAPIPTYRQSPANRLFFFKRKVGPADVSKTYCRCFPALPHHSSRMKMPLEALQTPSTTKTQFAFPFTTFFTSSLYDVSILYQQSPTVQSPSTLSNSIALSPLFSWSKKSCEINHFGLFLY